MRFTCFVLLSVVIAPACTDSGAAEPEDTLARFIDLMDRSAGNAGAVREAYDLLDRAAQAELERRARKAEALSGRRFSPWQMLAEGRFRLRFAPLPGGMRTEMQGDQRALVTVEGEAQKVVVPMVRQAGRWRVVLDLPPMAAPGPRGSGSGSAPGSGPGPAP